MMDLTAALVSSILDTKALQSGTKQLASFVITPELHYFHNFELIQLP